MKQTILPALLLAALMLTASTASAQGLRVNVNGNASATPASVKTQAEVGAGVESRGASSTEARAEMQLNIVKRLSANAARVLEATVNRLEQIIVRIESRITKLKAAGAATLESEEFVSEAKVHLEKAEVSISALSSIELGGETIRENFSEVRSAATEAKLHIRAAHTALMKAVRSLKASGGVKVESEARATTTSN